MSKKDKSVEGEKPVVEGEKPVVEGGTETPAKNNQWVTPVNSTIVSPQLKFTKVRDVKTPARAHEYDAGLDFFVPNEFQEVQLELGEQILIKSGIKVNVPEGYALIAYNKSGVSVKKGLTVLAAVVDHGYQNEVHINLAKVSKGSEDTVNKYDPRRTVCTISPGEKIVQFILMPVVTTAAEVAEDEIYSAVSERGENGFGSSGQF